MSAILTVNGTNQTGYFAIPHLVLQSFDDPISTWRTNAASDPSSPLFPHNLVRQNPNLVVLLTEKGGHIGWPMGWSPRSWEYMNNLVAAGFVSSYAATRKNNTEEKLTFHDQQGFPPRLEGHQKCTTPMLVGNEILSLTSMEHPSL
jgi:hypothetical protein